MSRFKIDIVQSDCLDLHIQKDGKFYILTINGKEYKRDTKHEDILQYISEGFEKGYLE